MFIFGYSFGGEVTDVKVIVVNHDEGVGEENLADEIIRNLDTEILALEYSNDEIWARESVERGEAWALILFPPNFTKDAFSSLIKDVNNVSAIQIILDGSDPTIATAVVKAVHEAMMETMQERGIGMPVSTNLEYVYGEEAEFIDFLAPGVMGMVVMMISFLLTIVSFVRERTTGTLNRLLASPITEAEMVVGYALAFSLISLVQSSIILGVAILIFNVSVQGSIVLTFSIIVLSAISFQGLGILLSTTAKTEFQAVQFMPLLFMPSILLAGILWPLEAIPSFVRPISFVIPLKYVADALRSVMIRGWGIEKILLDLTILVAFAVGTVATSVMLMKGRE
jgi:ABC-2 type transport system permease protein